MKHHLYGVLLISLLLIAIIPNPTSGLNEEEHIVANCNQARSNARLMALSLISTYDMVVYGHSVGENSWVVMASKIAPDGLLIMESLFQINYRYQSPNNCDDGDLGAENVSFMYDKEIGHREKKNNPDTTSTDYMDILILIGIVILVAGLLYYALPYLAAGGGGGGSCLLDKIVSNTGNTVIC